MQKHKIQSQLIDAVKLKQYLSVGFDGEQPTYAVPGDWLVVLADGTLQVISSRLWTSLSDGPNLNAVPFLRVPPKEESTDEPK